MKLSGKKVGIFCENLYDVMELWVPYYRLLEEGAEVILIGPKVGTYTSKHGYPVQAAVAAEDVNAAELDGIIVPGGFAPDLMRRNEAMLSLVREVSGQGKLVSSICHAAWVLISAGVIKGRRVACLAAIKDDVINAGAEYVDEAVVVDGPFVTSRTPLDLPAFCRTLVEKLA